MNILGIGDLQREGEYLQALVAIYDLEGFTEFCNQVDSHLVVPEYLRVYLTWLFEQLSAQFIESRQTDIIRIWGSLPLYAKFTGDGVLFIWNTHLSGGQPGLGNIIIRLQRICELYKKEFLKKYAIKFSKIPSRSRVGIARGQIISLGSNQDFVGSCINIATKLQKLSQLSFAVSRRGFEFPECFGGVSKAFILKKTSVPGVGDDEAVIILSSEFDALSPEEQAKFKEV